MTLSAQLNSKINSVKVYAAGATVTRLATLTIAPADLPTQVEVIGLPLALDDRSIRVRIEGAIAESLLATDVRVGLSVPPRSLNDAPTLETEIRWARAEVEQLESLIKLIDREIRILYQLEVPDRPTPEAGKAPPPSPISARLALTNFKDEQIRIRTQERRQVREKLRHAREHLEDLLQQQARASSDREVKAHELRKTAIVRLESGTRDQELEIRDQGLEIGEQLEQPAEPRNLTSDRPVQLVVEYFVPGARWTPTYICQLDTATNAATIALRALICQNTGEDWSGVQLELSTAEPLAWCELPELPSLRLGRAQQFLARRDWRLPPAGAATLFADFDRQRISVTEPQQQFGLYPVKARSIDAPPPDWKALNRLEEEETAISEFAPTSTDVPSAMRLSDDFGVEQTAPSSPDYTLLGAAGSVPPAAERKRKAMSTVSRAAMAPAPAALMSLPVAPQPDESPQLTYSMMRLGAPEDQSHRGKLTIASQPERYLESLERQQVTVKFGVNGVIQQAIEQATSCLSVPLPPGGVQVRSIAGSFDYAYQADGRVDVLSDGQFHAVALTSQSAAVDLRYVVVPREDTNVFRIAQLRNPLRSPLLAGTADVYVDREYILSTTIPTVPAQGQMELGLGVEQAIKVARNAFFQEVRSGKILVAFNELRHQLEVAIVNNLPKPINIEVRERLPVPRDGAKVDVEINEVSPAWEKYEQEDRNAPIKGGYRWQVQVPGGGRSTLSVQYTIKTYADSELIGGNRRET